MNRFSLTAALVLGAVQAQHVVAAKAVGSPMRTKEMVK